MDIKTLDDEIMLSDGRVIKMPVKSLEKNKDNEKGKIKVEKTPNVWGSSAGAGSDYFDIYRKQRYEENERMELIEKKWKEYNENKIFQSKRKSKIEYIEKKRLKRKNKRLIKKNKIKQQKSNKKCNVNETALSKSSMDLNGEKGKESNNDAAKANKEHGKSNSSNNNSSNGNDCTSDHDVDNMVDEEDSKKEPNEGNGILAHPVDTNNYLVVKENEIF